MTSSNQHGKNPQTDCAKREDPADNARERELELHRRLNLTPQMLSVLEPDGRISWVNEVALDYIGLSWADFGTDDVRARFIHPDDIQGYNEDRQSALARGMPFDTELRLRGKHGNYRWFLIRYNPLKDAAGRTLRWYGGATDIEDRKRAEEAVRRSETYLAEAQRLTHTGSWAWDPRSDKMLYCSEEVYRIFEVDPQEPPPSAEVFLQRVHPEDRDKVRAKGQMGSRDKTERTIEIDYRLLLPNGTIKYILNMWHPVFDGAGEFVEIIGTSVDVTERKRAEEALRCSEAYLAEAQKLSHTGSWTWSPVTRESPYWSEEMFRIYGLDPQQGPPASEAFWERIHPEDRDSMRELMRKAAREKKEYEHYHRIVLPDGTIKHIHAIGHPVLNRIGDVVEFVGTAIDVTERKRAEDALCAAYRDLEQREAKIQRLVDADIVGIFMWELEGRILEANDEFLRIIGYYRDDVVSGRLRWPDLTPPEWLDRDTQLWVPELKRTGRLQPFEKEYFRKDGSRIPVLIGTASFDESTNQGVAFVLDLTERKRAEEALRRSEKELRDLIETMPAMAWSALPDGSNAFVTRQWAEYTGLSAEQTSGSGWQSTVHPEDLDRHLENWRRSLATGQPFEHETRLRRAADGQYRWFLIRGVPLRDEQGNILKWYGIVTDIEDRKRAEEALRRSEKELQDIFDTIPAIAFATAADGSRSRLNRRWCEYTGILPQWAGGVEVDNPNWREATRLHPEDFEGFMKSWLHSMSTGEPFEHESRLRAANGEYRWFLIRAVPMRDEQGNILKWYGIDTDIEDRKRAEEAVRRSEKELQDIFDTIPAIAFATAADSTQGRANQRWREYTGVSPQWESQEGVQPDRATWRESTRIHPEDLDGFVKSWLTSTSTGEPFEREARLRRADGEYRWFLIRAVPMRDEQGNILKWYGIDTDIEDRKRAEETFRRSEAYLAEAQRLSHTGSWAFRPGMGKAFYWSEEMFRIFGLDPQQGPPAAETFWERVHPEDRDRTYELMRRAAREKTEYEHDHRIVLPDGTLKHIHAIGHPALDHAGDVVEFVGTAVDVTDRKRAEEELRESEERFRNMADIAPVMIWVSGPDKLCTYFNQQWLDFTGRKMQDELGNGWAEGVHADDYARCLQTYISAFDRREPFRMEYRLRRSDGQFRWIDDTGVPRFSPGGEVFLGYIGSCIDITDRKRAEEERERLRQLQAELARMNRVSMMGELAASLGHEIKQPIAAAVSNAEACLQWLAREQPDLAEVREAATEMVKEARRAAEIMTRTRALFKKEEIKREVLDLNEVIIDTVSLIREEADRRWISVRTELSPELPRISADRVQLQQVLMNLMFNGLEAMRGTRGELIIRSQRDDEGRPLISVSDVGKGLPVGESDKIFDAFFTTKPQGTGMGLAISRSIIESHGGRLWATANSGPGATFCFTLPKEVAESA